MQRVIWDECKKAGLDAELEKGGLLTGKPQEECPNPEPEDTASGPQGDPDNDDRRRPADIWLPRGPGGRGGARPVAYDVGFSFGLQHDTARWSVTDPERAINMYRSRKENFKDTLKKCLDQGFSFTPLIFESHGGCLDPKPGPY